MSCSDLLKITQDICGRSRNRNWDSGDLGKCLNHKIVLFIIIIIKHLYCDTIYSLARSGCSADR